MFNEQLKRLATIVLAERLIRVSQQRTIRALYEEITKADSESDGRKNVIAEFEELEKTYQRIETEDDPRDRRLFGLE